ncbi:MAG: hypothetical protein HZA84_00990, partial [Thaumarchaeota archaeon]|nr:hypothetical protein [Nitrososphaerota archaeon]
DDVVVYSRALSQDEIGKLYLAKLPQNAELSLFESLGVFDSVDNQVESSNKTNFPSLNAILSLTDTLTLIFENNTASPTINNSLGITDTLTLIFENNTASPTINNSLGITDSIVLTIVQGEQVTTDPQIVIDERGKDYHKVEFANGTGFVEFGLPEWIYENATGKYVDHIATETDTSIAIDSMQVPFEFDKTNCSVSIFEQGRLNQKLAKIVDKYYWKVMESNNDANWKESSTNNVSCNVSKIENSTGIFINSLQENENGRFLTVYGKKIDQPLEVFLYYTNKNENTTNTKIGFVSHMEGVNSDEIDFGNEQVTTDTKMQQKNIKNAAKKLFKQEKEQLKDTLKELKTSQKLTKQKSAMSKAFSLNGEGKNSLLFNFTKAYKEFKQVQVENENGRLDTTIEFLESAPIVKTGETVFLDPVFGFSTGTNIEIRTTGVGSSTVCPAPNTKSTLASVTLRIRPSTSSTSPSCTRITTEWNISTIPDDAIIQDTRIRYDISSTSSNGRSMDINSMENSPKSSSSASGIWNDIGDGTTFSSNNSNSTTNGNDKVSDLGTTADLDLQNNLVDDWWAVGIKAYDETRDGVLHPATFSGVELRVDYRRSSNPTENLGLVDTVTKTTVKRFTENLGFTDNMSTSKLKSISENLGLRDTLVKAAPLSLTENLGMTDAVARSITQSLTENLGMTDNATTSIVKLQLLSENLGFTDNIANIATKTQALTENLGLVDNITITATKTKLLSENLGITDNASAASSRILILSENLGFTDNVSRITTKTLTEFLGLTDVITTISSRTKSITENLGLADDVAVAASSRLQFLTEKLGLVDNITMTSTRTKSLSENLGITDNTARSIVKLQLLTENLGLTDTTARSSTLSLTENLGLTDTTARSSTLSLSENLGMTDAVARSITQSLTENLGMTDNATTSIVKLQLLTENLGMTDTTARITTKLQSLIENLGMNDVTGKSIPLSLSENLGLVDNRVCEVCLAQVGHIFVEQTTRQTSSSTSYVNITGATITSSNFVAGNKYLLVFNSLLDGSNAAGGDFGIRTTHGNTAFTGSEMVVNPTSTTTRTTYHWFTVWTATNEDINLQFKTRLGSHTVGADQITMFALNLSDDFIENVDWKYAEDTTSASLTTSFGSRASTSITPQTAGDDWLVMSTASHSGLAATRQLDVRLARSGEASSNQPEFIQQGADATNDKMAHTPFRVFNLSSTSNTFTLESRSIGGSSGTYQSSAVFLINLDKFKQDFASYTETNIDLSATDYGTEVQTLSTSLTCQSDVWVMGTFASDVNAAALYTKGRLQVDNADQPPTQTSPDAYQQEDSWGTTEELPLQYQTVESLSSGSHTIDLDASTQTALAGRSAEDRQLFAIPLVPKNRIHIKLLTENLGLVDTAATTKSLDKSLTENLGMNDAVIKTASISLSENLGMTDNTVLSSTVSLSENLGMTDNTARSATIALTENLGLTDTATTPNRTQSLTENLGMTADVIAAESSFLQSLTENLGMTADTATITSGTKSLIENLGITDTTTRSVTQSLTENLGMTDNTVTTSSRIQSLTENLGMTADTATITSGTKLLSENIGINDAVAKGIPLFLSENLGLVDNRVCEVCLAQVGHIFVEQTTRQTSSSTSYV